MKCHISLLYLIALMLTALLLSGCSTSLSEPTPTPTPIPTPTTGQIRGILQFEGTPSFSNVVVLLTTPPSIAGGRYLWSISIEEVSPDNSGAFLFEGVSPGKYSLSLKYAHPLAPSPSPLVDEQGVPIVFEVQAGQVTDLKTIPVKK